MSEFKEILTDTAFKICTGAAAVESADLAAKGEWPVEFWRQLEGAGLTAAAIDEARGGTGTDFTDIMALVRTVGKSCVAVPLIETWLAELALAASGLPPQQGALTIGPVLRSDRLSLARSRDSWELTGSLRRVAWGRHAKALIAVADYEGKACTIVVQSPKFTEFAENYAGEPRDTIHFHAHSLSSNAVSIGGWSRTHLFAYGALAHSVQIAGALEAVLEQTVKYAGERVQFGRPIGKFQAVQQQISVLASHVSAASAAANSAVDASRHGLAPFEIAAAKVRGGEAAGIAAGIAHQVHGAMGWTHEHSLHRGTCRLWSWRDEFGTESEWAEWIGQRVAEIGGPGLWPFLTSSIKPMTAETLF